MANGTSTHSANSGPRQTTFAEPKIVIRKRGASCVAELAEDDWQCPVCAGRGGSMAADERGYEFFEACACEKLSRRLALFNAANIGVRYQDATLESFQAATPDQQMARNMAQDFTLMYPQVRGGLVFWGPVGTGKTHLVVGIFRELTLRKGVGCRFVDYGNLLQDIKRSYSSHQGDSSVMLPLVNVDLLVIDELGKGRNTEWEQTVLDDLISRRYNANRITLCTTNFEPWTASEERAQSSNPAYHSRSSRSMGDGARETLRDRIGERIFSRLCEMCEFVQVTGSDYRRTAQGTTRR
jgi:DNA replication protein DnaC